MLRVNRVRPLQGRQMLAHPSCLNICLPFPLGGTKDRPPLLGLIDIRRCLNMRSGGCKLTELLQNCCGGTLLEERLIFFLLGAVQNEEFGSEVTHRSTLDARHSRI